MLTDVGKVKPRPSGSLGRNLKKQKPPDRNLRVHHLAPEPMTG